MDCRLTRNKNQNRCKKLKKLIGIPKKDLKWSSAKLRYPRFSSRGDADRDGKKNKKDCRPFNKKKQDSWDNPYYGVDIVTTPRLYKAYEILRYGREVGLPAIETHKELREKGYSGDEMRTANQLYNDSLKGKVIST